ncbi:epoxide hydrolase 1-like [Glandiceps talaboti]
MGFKVAIFAVAVAIVTGLCLTCYLGASPMQSVEYGDGWWGRGDKPAGKEDESIRPFTIKVEESVLEDLKQRLNNTRFFEAIEGTKFHYGTNVNYMRNLVDYWKTSYDWRKHEATLNRFEQYKTIIEGIEVHFIHAKPKGISKEKIKPLLMVHGWPGSFVEFYKIIPMLTDPLSHGGTEDDAFEVVCPSIPGFGFSEAPHKPGFDFIAAARVFDKLMTRLGHHKYYYQGGDFGGFVGVGVSLIQPSHVLGYHTNFAVGQPPLFLLKLAIGSIFPSLFFDEEEVSYLYPVSKKFFFMLRESGYLHLQATRPDTLGHGLTDSPAGLAAYMLEKFPVSTNPAYIDLEDGGFHKHITMDEALTNVMIYWINGNMVSAMRFYKEGVPQLFTKYQSYQLNVPVGIADFKYETDHMPRACANMMFPDLVSLNRIPKGGHFAALEEPKLLAGDFRQFVRKVEERKRHSS